MFSPLHRLARMSVFGLLLALLTGACGGGEEAAPTAAPPTPTSPAVSTPITGVAATPTPTLATPTVAPAPTTEEPRYGGTLRLANSPHRRWDNHAHLIFAVARDFARLMFNGVVRYDIRTDTVQPDLAESWTVEDNGDIVFNIRKGVRFHNKSPVNGRELTVQDIKWNLDRIRGASDNPSVNAQMVFKSRFRNVEDVQIVGDSTVRLKMRVPDVNILLGLSFEQMTIFAPEAAVNGFFDEPKTQIGTGPFVGDLLQFPGANRMVKNPNYWRKDAQGRQLPYVDRVELVVDTDLSTRAALLKSGRLDWAPLQNVDDVKFFQGRSDVKITDTFAVDVGGWGWAMNVSKPPFDDIRVRRALNLTIDRQQWRDLIYRGAGYLMGPIGAKVAWGAWSQEKLESLPGLRGGAAKQQDIEEAKRLIREATGRDTISITMSTTTTTPSEQEQLLQFMLRKAGIELRLQTVAAGVDTRSTQATAQWQLNRVSAGGGITPDQALFQIYRSDAPEHSMQWFDTTLDRLADEQARTLDFEKRKQLLDQIQQYIWDNAVFAPDVRFLFRWIAWNYVKNWAGPDHTHNYRAAQIEEVWIAR